MIKQVNKVECNGTSLRERLLFDRNEFSFLMQHIKGFTMSVYFKTLRRVRDVFVFIT